FCHFRRPAKQPPKWAARGRSITFCFCGLSLCCLGLWRCLYTAGIDNAVATKIDCGNLPLCQLLAKLAVWHFCLVDNIGLDKEDLNQPNAEQGKQEVANREANLFALFVVQNCPLSCMRFNSF